MRLKFTLKSGINMAFHVWEKPSDPPMLSQDHGLVAEAADQNRLRYKLGVLGRMGLGQIWHDIKIDRKADGTFRIWVYCYSWKGRPSYYSGMLYAYERTHRKNAAKKRRTV